ncbi:DUF5672 family protein [Spirosoma soli]|uniref:DUF5672 family protein n=1 Tax=Spirosoma soli TaxID=1770529 RepID=A0ABW5M7V7_9BACT
MKPVAVIIPIYKASMSAHELISFQQCLKALRSHPIFLVKPHSLNLNSLLATHSQLQVESFDDLYFQSISGYNKLLCSELFYERFLAYEYILISQLDVFIFRDDLLDWCQRGYDYVGAPQFSNIRAPDRMEPKTLREKVSLPFQKPLLNGGMSLRRVKGCLRLLRIYHTFFGTWHGNEDSFFSLHYPRFSPFRPLMHLPSPHEALKFAVEMQPRLSLQLNGNKLPMGCHAWDVYDLDFWRPIFKEYGYTV